MRQLKQPKSKKEKLLKATGLFYKPDVLQRPGTTWIISGVATLCDALTVFFTLDPLLQDGDLGIVLGQGGRFLLLQLCYGLIEFSDFFIHRSCSFLWGTARPLGFGLCHFRSPVLCSNFPFGSAVRVPQGLSKHKRNPSIPGSPLPCSSSGHWSQSNRKILLSRIWPPASKQIVASLSSGVTLCLDSSSPAAS